MTTKDLDRMLAHYVIAAIWCSTDENDDPLASDYDQTDIAPAALSQMREDCKAFGEANAAQIEQWAGAGDAWEQAGHDFWLTRNGHGTGFWDRGDEWPSDGTDLHAASKVYGSCGLYVGDDSLIHLD